MQTISAKRLVTIHGSGEGSAPVGATWSELAGKCLAMLRRRECGETENSESLVLDVDTTETPAEARYVADESIVRTAGLGRTYTELSLSNFNILSAASASSRRQTKKSPHATIMFLQACSRSASPP